MVVLVFLPNLQENDCSNVLQTFSENRKRGNIPSCILWIQYNLDNKHYTKKENYRPVLLTSVNLRI